MDDFLKTELRAVWRSRKNTVQPPLFGRRRACCGSAWPCAVEPLLQAAPCAKPPAPWPRCPALGGTPILTVVRGVLAAQVQSVVCVRERERAVWSRCTWCQYVTPLPLAYVDPRFSIPLFFIGALALYESYFLEPA